MSNSIIIRSSSSSNNNNNKKKKNTDDYIVWATLQKQKLVSYETGKVLQNKK